MKQFTGHEVEGCELCNKDWNRCECKIRCEGDLTKAWTEEDKNFLFGELE